MAFMQRSSESSTILFRDRLHSVGLSPKTLSYFLVSLKTSKALPTRKIRQIERILKASPDLQNLDDLSSADQMFIENLVEENFLDHKINDSKKLNIIGIIVNARRVIFSILGIVCIYVLANALVSGKSSVSYFSDNPYYGLIAVLVLLCVLFLLEGTQISIATLRLKDIDLVAGIKPSVKALHAKYRSEENVQDYLAGRQLCTIITVFFISRICSFPEIQIIPGTEIEIPELLSPWFSVLFFDFGILAALVALWLGQLAPQFWANKQPVRFLSLPIANLTVRLSHAFESIGITDLGYSLTAGIEPEKSIPTSTREKFNLYDLSNGYAATGLTMRWQISEKAILETMQEEFSFSRSGIATFSITEEIQNDVIRRDTEFQLVRNGTRSPCEVEVSEAQTVGGNSFLKYAVHPRHASFQDGDVMHKTLTMTMAGDSLQSSRFHLSRPVRYLLISLEVPNEIAIGQPRLQSLDEHHADPAHDFAEMHALEKMSETDAVTTYGYFRPFPNTDLSYALLWGRID